MALHHKTLGAALAKYSPLILEGKTETEIKVELAKDEKEFSPEDIDEIYSALVAPPAEEEKEPVYIVIVEFRDADNFDLRYDIGDDVSGFDKSRLEKLEALGLVEKQ